MFNVITFGLPQSDNIKRLLLYHHQSKGSFQNDVTLFFDNPGGRGAVAADQVDHDERAGLVGQRERGSRPMCQGQGCTSSRHRHRWSQTPLVASQKSIRKGKKNHFHVNRR